LNPVVQKRSRAIRIIGRLALLLVLLLAVLALISIYTIRRSFPVTSGTVHIPELRAPVSVYRDNYGVAQIYARNTHDLFLVQGYVHAQDRFWQMDVWRHTGSGRLSEMFGKPLIDTDRFLRTLGFARIAQREMDAADSISRQILNDYASGVNTYLKDHAGSKLSLEYSLLRLQNRGYMPERWNPIHSITWGKLMAWDLGENMDSEINRSLLTRVLTRDQLEELYPPYPLDHPLILPGTPGQAGGTGSPPSGSMRALQLADDHVRALNDFLGGGIHDGIGSNNWVISGNLTATGKPVLCNDPHLGTQMPSIWYQIGLHCDPVGPECPFDVAGFSFAGVPGVIIGHNNRVAWGFTNVGPDVMDLFVEKTNPVNTNQYEFNGQWVDMGIVPETIQVAGSSPVALKVRYTRHGPIISDSYKDLTDFSGKTRIGVPTNYATALRWTALDVSTIFPAIWRMNLAQNWNEFRDAAARFDVPSQNIVYADADGNIGYQLPGRIPIRKGGDGRYPVPGWTDQYEWTGFIAFDELPSAFNPPSGFVVTANNAVTAKDYPYFISSDWDYGFRAERIVDMIESSKSRLSTAYIEKMQYDNKNLNADVLVPVLMKLALNDPRMEKARDLLKSWDGQQHMNSSAAALFETFWKQLLSETFHDNLPQQQWPGGGNRWIEVVRHLINAPDSFWWDNRNTPQRENRDSIFLTAFRKSVLELERRFGSDPRDWRWGALHTVTYRNATFGHSGIRLVEALFNRGPYPVSGGTAIVNATGWNAARSFDVTALPSMRMLVDFSNFDNSLTVHSPGQSGHAFSPHYKDMVDLWRKGQYYPMHWTRSSVESNSKNLLQLQP
jgi:penicillin amidase